MRRFIKLPIELLFQILLHLNNAKLIVMKKNLKEVFHLVSTYKYNFALNEFYGFYALNDPSKIVLIKKGKNYIFEANCKANNLPLKEHKKEKWLEFISQRIPLFIINKPLMNELLLLVLYKFGKKKNIRYIIKLPVCPTELAELKNVKYWLEQIFLSIFYRIELKEFTFNHEMIKFLFNKEINKIYFRSSLAILNFNNNNAKSCEFIFTILLLDWGLDIYFEYQNTNNESNNIIINLLLNFGERIPGVDFYEFIEEQIIIYNLLIDNLETCCVYNSVRNIRFFFDKDKRNWKIFQLNIKGIETNESNELIQCYKIINKLNKNITFVIEIEVDGEWILFIDIKKIINTK